MHRKESKLVRVIGGLRVRTLLVSFFVGTFNSQNRFQRQRKEAIQDALAFLDGKSSLSRLSRA